MGGLFRAHLHIVSKCTPTVQENLMKPVRNATCRITYGIRIKKRSRVGGRGGDELLNKWKEYSSSTEDHLLSTCITHFRVKV